MNKHTVHVYIHTVHALQYCTAGASLMKTAMCERCRTLEDEES